MVKYLWAAAFIAVGLVEASTASAALSVGDVIRFVDREGGSISGFTGGEYGVYGVTPVSASELFRTFCIQTNENLNFGSSFTITGITKYATYEPDASGGKDYISAETAYLYTKFMQGVLNGGVGGLSNYDYTAGSSEHGSDASKLQQAFWYLENEISTSWSSLTTQTKDWITEATNAIAAGSWSGTGDVYVLNIKWANGTKAQDVLYYNPPPPPPPGNVPEPSTMVVWGAMGLIFSGVQYRRRQRRIA